MDGLPPKSSQAVGIMLLKSPNPHPTPKLQLLLHVCIILALSLLSMFQQPFFDTWDCKYLYLMHGLSFCIFCLHTENNKTFNRRTFSCLLTWYSLHCWKCLSVKKGQGYTGSTTTMQSAWGCDNIYYHLTNTCCVFCIPQNLLQYINTWISIIPWPSLSVA